MCQTSSGSSPHRCIAAAAEAPGVREMPPSLPATVGSPLIPRVKSAKSSPVVPLLLFVQVRHTDV